MLTALLVAACRPPSSTPTTPPASDPSASAETGSASPPGHTGAPADDPLVVLSLNLHCLRLDGTPYASNTERFAEIARTVADREVDAIAAQEVCVGAEDARELLLGALAAETGEAWDLRWVEAHLAWEGTPDEADEGVAVVARRPIAAVRELAYATPGTLRRVALAATLAEGPTLVTVHLDYDDPVAREDQARQTAVAALVDGPDAIVAGDLNARPGEPAPDALLAAGFVDATASLDASRIDHQFVHRGASVAPAGAELVLLDVSDHPGVLVTLAPRPAPAVPLTRLVAQVDVGFGRWVAVRGDAGPLAWDRGSWAVPVAADRWEWVSTELDAPFAFKALRDDVDWELGPDHAGTAGATTTFSPTFP